MLVAGHNEALPPAAEVNAWLKSSGRQLVPRFPRLMEGFYDKESRAERMLAMRICTFSGWMTGLVLAALGWPLLSDAHDAIVHAWLETAIPVGVACNLLQMNQRLPLRLQEWQSAFAALVAGICMAHVVSASAHAPTAFLFGGIVLLILLDGTAARLSMVPAAALVSGLLITFIVGIQQSQRDVVHEPYVLPMLVVMMTACTLYAMYGAWRLDTEVRRSFALALRERIERRELAVRNAVLGQMLGDDALTGLANRRAFDERMAQDWVNCAETATPLSLILVDVDHFKRFNDTQGHPAGDACLRQVAECLRANIAGPRAMAARVGGEEFAVLMPGVDAASAGNVADFLRLAVQTMALPHRGCERGYVTISAGVATLSPEPGSPAALLVQAADQALYAAKRGGRNRVVAAIGLERIAAGP